MQQWLTWEQSSLPDVVGAQIILVPQHKLDFKHVKAEAGVHVKPTDWLGLMAPSNTAAMTATWMTATNI